MARLEIVQVPVLSDNYAYLLHEPETGATGVVDPGAAEPVQQALKEQGWSLTHILNTHHHGDHTGGNAPLQKQYDAAVVASREDQQRIPGLTHAVGDGETFMLGNATATVLAVPGHTGGHIAFWFPESLALFSGDALFVLGCGRVFEGTPAMMWASLDKMRRLPDEAQVYCAHEYTQKNAQFALTIEQDNEALQRRAQTIADLRRAGRPTVPASMAEERAANPFLRCDEPAVAEAVGLPGAAPEKVFAEVRRRKDGF